MDWQQAFLGLLGLAIAGISWYIRGMVADLKSLQDAIAAHKLHVSETYPKKTEINKLEETITSQFTRLHERLDKLTGERL